MTTDLAMLFIKALITGVIVTGVLGFIFIKVVSKSTDGALTRLNKETEGVRDKQKDLTNKIKEASEELNKRRAEADQLVTKMKEEAEQKAKEEREKILKKAREDGESILAKVQKTKDDVRKVLQKEAEIKVIDFTLILLNEILTEHTRKIFNESLISEFFEGLEDVDMEMIKEDITTVDIITASPLPDNLKARLSEIIKKKLTHEVTMNNVIDEKIIAGILLKFGSLSLNGSLANMLKEKSLEIKDRHEKGLLEV